MYNFVHFYFPFFVHSYSIINTFLHSKLHRWYDKDDKYIEVVNDMYEDNVLNDEDIGDLGLGKENNDDIER